MKGEGSLYLTLMCLEKTLSHFQCRRKFKWFKNWDYLKKRCLKQSISEVLIIMTKQRGKPQIQIKEFVINFFIFILRFSSENLKNIFYLALTKFFKNFYIEACCHTRAYLFLADEGLCHILLI